MEGRPYVLFSSQLTVWHKISTTSLRIFSHRSSISFNLTKEIWILKKKLNKGDRSKEWSCIYQRTPSYAPPHLNYLWGKWMCTSTLRTQGKNQMRNEIKTLMKKKNSKIQKAKPNHTRLVIISWIKDWDA